MHPPEISTKHNQNKRFVPSYINGNLLNKISILEGMLLNNDLICIQEHFLPSPSLSLFDKSTDFCTFSVPVKRVHSQGRPSGNFRLSEYSVKFV